MGAFHVLQTIIIIMGSAIPLALQVLSQTTPHRIALHAIPKCLDVAIAPIARITPRILIYYLSKIKNH